MKDETSKNHSKVAGVALAVLVALFLLFLAIKMRNEASEQPQKDKPLATLDGAAQLQEKQSTQTVQLGNPRAAKAVASNTEEYVCFIAKHLCLDEPLTAATEAEAHWLQQFGYPSLKRMETLRQMPQSQLEALSNAGDLPARIVLGQGKIAAGYPVEGRAAMTDALVNGSTYAAYALAESNNPNVPGSMRSEAIAFYRLAYLLGDWKAAQQIYRKYELDPSEMRLADDRAMELYRNLLKERGRRRLRVRLAPRP